MSTRPLLTKIAAAVAAAVIATAAPAAASHTAKRGGWIHPPTDFDTFTHIYGFRQDGFTADHWIQDGTVWMHVNTLYPPRRWMLFDYCPSATSTPAGEYTCQTTWDDFYTFLYDHRDGGALSPLPSAPAVR